MQHCFRMIPSLFLDIKILQTAIAFYSTTRKKNSSNKIKRNDEMKSVQMNLYLVSLVPYYGYTSLHQQQHHQPPIKPP